MAVGLQSDPKGVLKAMLSPQQRRLKAHCACLILYKNVSPTEANARCFHSPCIVLIEFLDGSYLIENRQGFVRRVTDENSRRV